MTNTSDKTIAGKIDTSDEACERACKILPNAWREAREPTHGEMADIAALIRALCAERDEATRKAEEWHSNFQSLERAVVGETGASAILTAGQLRARTEALESELSSLRAKGCGWKCKANPYAAVPSDCDWPNCGCDPHVERVIAGLREGDWGILSPKEVHDRAKGCGVPEEAIARLKKIADTLVRCDPATYNVLDLGLELRAVLALLQSAPQDAKLAAPMEGEVAKVSREYVLSALRWREVSEFDGRGRNGLTIEQTADLICNRLANALESLSRRNEGDGERWRHKKRGTTYTIVGNAQVQAEEPLTDYEVVKVYRCEQTGELWVRRRSEFNDGRFEQVPLPPPPETAKEAQR